MSQPPKPRPELSQRRYISKRSRVQPNHALAGRAGLQDGQPRELLRQVGWAGCGVPSTRRGYHTPARGQSRTAHVWVPSRAAPGLACGRAVPGRRDATRAPACKIIGDRFGADDRLDTLWSLNTSIQPKMTTNDGRLQSRKPQVIGAIHEQPLLRSENPWVLGSIPRRPTLLPGSRSAPSSRARPRDAFGSLLGSGLASTCLDDPSSRRAGPLARAGRRPRRRP